MVSYILHINVCAKVVFDSVISVGDTEDSLICPSFVCIIITRAWSSPLLVKCILVCGFVKVWN